MLGEWQVWTKAIPKSTCDNMLFRLKQLSTDEGNIGNSIVNHEIRKSKIAFVPDNNFYSDIYGMIDQYVTKINRDYFGFDISYGIHDVQFATYSGEEQGHYGWHHDVFFAQKEPYHRKLSFVLQLSDPNEYTGGDFQFRDVPAVSDEQFKPQGSLLIFPSFFYHRVTPVLTGTRYSLVSWIDGPRWR